MHGRGAGVDVVGSTELGSRPHVNSNWHRYLVWRYAVFVRILYRDAAIRTTGRRSFTKEAC